MTNREWLLKEMQSMSDEELVGIMIGTTICNEQTICEGRICRECRLDWLKGEHKKK